MKRLVAGARRAAALLWLGALVATVHAQEPAAEPALPSLAADEAARLRETAAAPVPAGADAAALRRHFIAKNHATRRLGDPALRLRVLRDAMAALPSDPMWPNDLAWALRDEGQFSEGRRMIERAVQLATRPADRLFFRSARALMMVRDRVTGAGEALQDLRRDALALLPTLPSPSVDRMTTLRVLGGVARGQADLDWQAQRLQATLASRVEALGRFAEALEAARALSPTQGDQRGVVEVTQVDLASAQRSRASALVALGRYADAELALGEHLDFIVKQGVRPVFAAGAHDELANLHFTRGDHDRAEHHLRRGIEVLDRLNFPRRHPWQTDKQRNLALTHWARGRYEEARRVFDELDRAVYGERGEPRRLYPLQRALVYLGSGGADAAAPLFEQVAAEARGRLGPGHYYTARSAGLQGVALWRGSDAGKREQGAELLRQAVVTILSPRNVDFLDDAGIRRQERTLIFDAYLEASAERGAMQALAALGVADRLIGGGTAQAVADAALRAAAGDAALADLVRDEQDTRAQLRALQQSESRVGDDQRARIGELESRRQQLHDRIRLAYPGYDRLVRPPLPNATDVAQRLARDEVLLLALPTDRWLYLWALTADDLPAFVRVDLGAPALAALVARLRAGLDFGASNARVPRFDAAAAHELYRAVVAPVAARLAGRRHLVVATAGPLATIPFAALLTAPAPAGAPGASAPWLAKQLAVSSVPNVASWLALRQLPPAQPAPEPLIAWADPRYAATEATATTGRRDAGPAAGVLRYEQLPRLPETRDEVRAIAAALRAEPERDLIVDTQATRQSVLEASRSGRLARKRVVVFATHGLTAGELPGLEQPALALAASPGDREPLAALLGLDDILGLKLNADWVVLSACNTAAADGRAGDALSGLARGFLYAGSRSLLVTHWAVETESAKLLTTATFEHHAGDAGAGKAESLRQAMLKVMNMPKYGHPAFWAPFALVGDGAR